ncbi:hypothetical protein DERP_011677 [Dermatophagoides pteronyssinus]|uniref:Transmembrane protein n=1 Tax=Dermatophagoides pteronyssinus TaxID=6956 RepID=A0ABQ8J374_DERPT|nr:hypothetical protein DERP_011677 [Dermatophagoides pteronyssinus]
MMIILSKQNNCCWWLCWCYNYNYKLLSLLFYILFFITFNHQHCSLALKSKLSNQSIQRFINRYSTITTPQSQSFVNSNNDDRSQQHSNLKNIII